MKMVEKEIKEIDPGYYTRRAVKKKDSQLFSKVRTRESKEVQIAKDCKQTVIKEEKRKLSFTQFDAPREGY